MWNIYMETIGRLVLYLLRLMANNHVYRFFSIYFFYFICFSFYNIIALASLFKHKTNEEIEPQTSGSDIVEVLEVVSET